MILTLRKIKDFSCHALQALGLKPSEDITGLKQKILAGFSQIFSFRKNSRGHYIPLVPFGLFNPMFTASINRPNLKFHFLPTRDRRKKPASYGQIAKNQRFLEKNFFYPTDEKTNEIKISHNKG